MTRPNEGAKPVQGVFRVARRVLALVRPYVWTVVAGFVLYLLGSAVTLVLPLGIQTLLDRALGGQDRGLLNILSLVLLALFVLRFAFSYVGSYCLLVASERVAIDLRTRLFGHMQRLDVGFFHEQRIGDLTSRITTDAAAIRAALNQNLVSTLMTAFQTVSAMAIMLWLNWRLALLVVVVAPGATLLSRLYGPSLQRLSRESVDRIGRSIAHAQEVLSGILVVKTFDRIGHETRRFRDLLAAVLDTAKRSAKAYSMFNALVNFLGSAANIALFWFGGLEVLSGRLSVGELVAFLFYSQMVATGISQAASQYGELHRMVGSSQRVFEILDLEPSVASPSEPLLPRHCRGRITLDAVSFAYAEAEPSVLDGLDLVVEPGETVGIVGLSGGGKTTLLHLLCRFYDPTAGRILLDGNDLRDLDLGWLRRQVALVAQDTFLFADTVGENIRYGRIEASDEEVAAAARAANAEDFILALGDGYATEIGERGVRLSGGQRQRIALARALLKASPVLVLDEATSAVDGISERLIQEALEGERGRRTTIIVAHRLGTVRDADRILVLDQGKIVECGRHEELMGRRGHYFGLVRGQLAEEPVAQSV